MPAVIVIDLKEPEKATRDVEKAARSRSVVDWWLQEQDRCGRPVAAPAYW